MEEKNWQPDIPIPKRSSISRIISLFTSSGRLTESKLATTKLEEDSATPSIVSHKQPLWQTRIKPYFASVILPLSTGAGITAGTTFGLVRHVQHEIANARVNSDPKKWMQEARTKAYDACYYGCNDCGDTNFSYKACEMTARGNVTGVICDGNLIWNWAARYPIECLEAVGEFYKADALKRLKQSYRNQLAIIIITVLAGVIGAVVTYKIWGGIVARCQARARPCGGPYRDEAAGQGQVPAAYVRPRIRGGSSGHSAGRIALLTTAFASILTRGSAYPCTGYDPKADQYFINANKTLYGVLHGWYSDCYDYTCDCSTTCSNSGGGIDGSSSTSCSTTCSTCTATDATPMDYLNATLGHVKACGFELVDAVDGDVMVRVANPLIEKKWWVKISVNMFNLTDDVTDPSIFCLHDFAGN